VQFLGWRDQNIKREKNRLPSSGDIKTKAGVRYPNPYTGETGQENRRNSKALPSPLRKFVVPVGISPDDPLGGGMAREGGLGCGVVAM